VTLTKDQGELPSPSKTSVFVDMPLEAKLSSDISMEGLSPDEPRVERYTLPRRDLQRDPSAAVPSPANKHETASLVPAPPKVLQKTEAENNPGMFQVTPPSQMFFYDVPTLYLKHVKGAQQAKLNAAAATRSMDMTVEAVSSLCNISARNLTVPDFTWCLYWLRENSYLKTQMSHVALCRNKAHLLEVAEEKVEHKTLENVTIYSRSDLREKGLDIPRLKAFKSEHLEGIPLYTATMNDVLFLLTQQDRPDWEEYQWLADLATFMGQKDDSGNLLSVDKRVEIAAEMTPAQLEALSDYIEIANDYGVVEIIRTVCSHCKGPIESEVSINAGMFL
jgi:hypothetical protein